MSAIVLDDIFQSTRPSRASTLQLTDSRRNRAYFNPQGPRGPRRYKSGLKDTLQQISIHKALAGLDSVGDYVIRGVNGISIHKALAGLDQKNKLNGPNKSISIHKALAGLDEIR